MAEVFSISGSSFGQDVGPPICPPGWQATPKGNCGAPTGGCPSSMMLSGACRDVRAIALQNALKALGRVVGDSALAAIGVDGFVGPETETFVNRAFTTHIGSGQAPANLRTGQLSRGTIAANAAVLTGLVGAEVTRRGGTITPPVITKRPPPVPPTDEVPVGVPAAAWALVGLNALAAGVGIYFAYRR